VYRADGAWPRWVPRAGSGPGRRVGWDAGPWLENLRDLEWSREEAKGAAVDFG
jgi:hypothetical protein